VSDLSLGEVSKKLGELWAKLGDSEKSKYQAKAEKLKKVRRTLPSISEEKRAVHGW